MNNEKTIQEIEVIKEAFDEKRNIMGYAPKEMIQVSKHCHKGGDIFITEEGELIDLEYQMKDFDERELVKYIELAEELYEINNVAISIYILCPKTINVTAPEIPIKSAAVFNIKLACFEADPVYSMLYYIKEKIDKNIPINEEDYENLLTIPMMGPKKEKNNLRIECFRLLKKAMK